MASESRKPHQLSYNLHLDEEAQPASSIANFFSLICSMLAMLMRSRIFALCAFLMFFVSITQMKKKDSLVQSIMTMTSCYMCCYLTYGDALRPYGIEINLGYYLAPYLQPLFQAIRNQLPSIF